MLIFCSGNGQGNVSRVHTAPNRGLAVSSEVCEWLLQAELSRGIELGGVRG